MATNNNDPFAEFELRRTRAKQQARAAGQEQVGAIQRRFASLGGLSGGAAIKTEQKAREAAAGQGQQATQSIDIEEAREKQRRKEIGEAREFARGERLGGQEFAGEQAGLGRQFAGEQAGLGREFAGEQSEKQRRFAASESNQARELAINQANAQRTFAAAQAGIQREFQREESASERGLREAFAEQNLQLAKQGLALEQEIASFNKEIASWQKGQPTDILGQLLGPGFSTGRGGGLGFVGDLVGGAGNLIGGLF